MKKLFASLLLIAASALPLSATVYEFGDFDYKLVDSHGVAWSTGNLALGKFGSAFTPSAGNVGSWNANWLATDVGFYDGSGPEWGAELRLTNNAVFATGDQLYLWAYNAITGPGREWVLLTDPLWKIISNSPLATDPVFFDFSARTTAIFGSVNNGQSLVTSAAVLAAAPVPEPATWVSILAGFGLMVVVGYRRRATLRRA